MRRLAMLATATMCLAMLFAPVAIALVRGTEGNDVLYGTPKGEVIRGFGGKDTVIARPGADLVFGNTGADRLNGGVGNDRLRGGRGADYIEDPSGRDRISGKTGDDVIVDVFNFETGQRDQIKCGPGRDEAYVDRQDYVAGDCEIVRRNAIP